jgi:hypothetical protein
MTDYVTPNWRERISNGEILMFPCTYQLTTSDCGGGSYTSVKDADGSKYYTSGGSVTRYQSSLSSVVPLTFTPDWSSLRSNATSQCIAAIDRTPYDFAEDLLELRETLSYIKLILGRIVDICTSFASSLGRSGSSVSVYGIADAYLEFRFALSPLIRTIYQVLEAFSKGSKTYTGRRKARGYSNEDSNSMDDTRYYWSGSVYDSFHRTLTATAECKAMVLYEVTNPIQDWRHSFGLRDKDLAVGLWKVAKLSFLVDRLFNVSNIIRGLLNLADPKVRILTGCLVQKYRTTTTLCFTAQVNPGWTVTVFGDTITDVNGGFERIPWAPNLLDTIPAVNWHNLVGDVTSVLDLLALSIQWLGKGR